MLDWLRLLSMIFYAPVRGMREVRDRASLGPVFFIAFLSQLLYVVIIARFAGRGWLPLVLAPAILFQSVMWLVALAAVVVPLLILTANMFERRGSFRVVLTHEYAPLASVLFYGLIATNIGTLVIAAFLHFSGIQAIHVANTIQAAPQMKEMFNGSPEWNALVTQQLSDPRVISEALFRMIKVTLF